MNRLHVVARHLSTQPAGARRGLEEVVIVGYARTPIGSLNGTLSSFKAQELGSLAIAAALKRSNLSPEKVEEVFMGQVLQAGVGQAPARQASLGAKIPVSVPCTTVNKVCASGMKSVIFGAQSIMLGQRSCVVAGGMESMSNVPFYLPGVRQGYRLGHVKTLDGMMHDGLWDPWFDCSMGMSAEKCSGDLSINREAQDSYAVQSYRRAQAAIKNGYFDREIVPVEVKSKSGSVQISVDEEPGRVKYDAIPKLRPSFKKDGTVTAANASVISDGAAAMVLMSRRKADELGLVPLALITGYADAATDPMDFPIAPALALPQALAMAGVKIEDVDRFEINEAFSVVALANMKLMGIPHDKINVWGGAVSLGHPLGCSGARILCTLLNVLETQNKQIGAAAICNGGGGASAFVMTRL
eukprot:gb/GEZN01007704.1/.p1 GENE.gb/GEZN01007704.1/~~gb/GEZN01007704.1/.p1  ORF type:complete len:425 (+),score=41.67 gb/GEZN01007704.1/:37-1275(+)